MSGDAIGFAVRHAPFSGVTYTVYLCLADSANDLYEQELWMSMSTLAKKARCSRRAAGLAVQAIIDAGLLEVIDSPFDHEGYPTGKPGKYRFLFPDDLEVVFENRRKRGAQPVRTPAQSVRTPDVRSECAPGAQPVRTIPREPNDNPPTPASGGAEQHQQSTDPERHALFVALEDVTHSKPRTVTERRTRSGRVSDLLALGATPDEVRARAAQWHRLHPSNAGGPRKWPTDRQLVRQWDVLAPPEEREPDPADRCPDCSSDGMRYDEDLDVAVECHHPKLQEALV